MTSYYPIYRIRCYCNRFLGGFEDLIDQLLAEGNSYEEIFNLLNLESYCCRMAILDPSFNSFDSENRSLIRGDVNPDRVDLRKFDYRALLGTRVKQIDLSTLKPADGVDLLDDDTSTEVVEKLATFATFNEPTIVGIPTVNDPDPSRGFYEQVVEVGENLQTSIVLGRTFLAG